LLELAFIDHDGAWFAASLDRERHVLADHPVQHLFDVANHVVDVQQLRIATLFTAEGKQLPREERGTLGGVSDFLGVGSQRVIGAGFADDEFAIAAESR
jgi:hypothetical protein